MTRHTWTPHEDALLRRLYPDLLASTVADAIGTVSTDQVLRRAARLQIGKSAVFYQREAARARQRGNGSSTRFTKGHQTWNKGSHFVAGGRSAETRFKKGSQPHTTQPVGSYRITKDGSLQRKIGTAPGSNSQRWRGVHELLWISAHGPVPAGHICVFRPGTKTAVLEEITLDKVECISFAENMRRNSYHTRLPKEFALLVQLRGALTRQINKKSQEETQ